MGWRIVKQPNGRFARWSDVVDDFTHVNLSRTEALEVCRREPGMGKLESEEKVAKAETDDMGPCTACMGTGQHCHSHGSDLTKCYCHNFAPCDAGCAEGRKLGGGLGRWNECLKDMKALGKTRSVLDATKFDQEFGLRTDATGSV